MLKELANLMKKQMQLKDESENLKSEGNGGPRHELLKEEMDILDKEKVLMEKIAKMIADGITGAELERLMDQLK